MLVKKNIWVCGSVKYGFCSRLRPEQLFWRTKKQPERNDVKAVLDAAALYSAWGFLFGKVKYSNHNNN